MYYMLECWGNEATEPASLDNVPEIEDVSWISGALITADIPAPIEVDLDTEEGSAMVPMFDVTILLLREDMIAALQEAGVDNLQIFDAVLRDPVSGVVHKNYKAVNIVGVVSVADLDNSDCQAFGAPIVDTDFDRLAIDPAKTHGLLMFRLAECVTGIVVHEKVKRRLQEVGIADLDFISPEDWIG